MEGTEARCGCNAKNERGRAAARAAWENPLQIVVVAILFYRGTKKDQIGDGMMME
jgi:hypothetical protein